MKKADIIRALSFPSDIPSIHTSIEHIKDNPELNRINGFRHYCDFVLNHVEIAKKLNAKQRMSYEIVYSDTLEKIKVTVEDHGIPRKGHLNDVAREILQDIESPEFRHLLDNEQIAISYGKVKAHYREFKHAMDYEGHLHNLYGLIKATKQERRNKTESELAKKLSA